MAVIDLVKWDGNSDILAWKFPSQELSTWSQLIVNETQEAFVVKGGVYEGPFGGGRHTLTTENIPIIRVILGLPFGGNSPFSAEVWFVNKIINLNIKWGTPDPIQIQDKKFKMMIPIRAFGQYGIRISNSKRFLHKLVGTVSGFDVDTLNSYFRGVFITKIKTEIANTIVKLGVSPLEISTHLEELSNNLRDSLNNNFNEYGLELTEFNVHSINLPEDDVAVISLKNALAKKAEMEIVGFSYQQERSFNVLEAAANNEGNSGALMGAGLGLGLGVGVGGSMANTLTNQLGAAFTQQTPDAGLNYTNKIELLKELGKLKEQGILSDEEFQAEKKKVLEGK
jgi:membrane protease subunit (stomatin/prohibitin family)